MSVNSMEPNLSNQSTQNGSVVLSFNKPPAGHTFIIWIYF
jgi:hypothetical protein